MAQATRDEVQAHNAAQIAEALSPENRWYTGEAVGHDPTPRECIRHYIDHGGAAAYRARLNTEKSPNTGDEVSG